MAGRNVGRTAWKIARLRTFGGSMLCRSESEARRVAGRWDGKVRSALRMGGPARVWFVDFEAELLKGGE